MCCDGHELPSSNIPSSVYQSSSWDIRLLQLASLVATWSKDPSTKVGAVVADANHRIISIGFNGFPRGVEDGEHLLMDRDEKLMRTIHAEENALLFTRVSIEGCTIYTTHFPCARCAAKIIQSGIAHVIIPQPSLHTASFNQRWAVDTACATSMFDEAGVEVKMVDVNNVLG